MSVTRALTAGSRCSARATAREGPSRPPIWAARSFPRRPSCRRGPHCRKRPTAGSSTAPTRAFSTIKTSSMVTSSGSDPRGWRRTCPPGRQTRDRRRSRPPRPPSRGPSRRRPTLQRPRPVRRRRFLRAAPRGHYPSRPPRRRDRLRSLHRHDSPRRRATLGRAEDSVHPVRATTAKRIGGRMGARCSQLPGQGPRVLRLAAQLRQAHWPMALATVSVASLAETRAAARLAPWVSSRGTSRSRWLVTSLNVSYIPLIF